MFIMNVIFSPYLWWSASFLSKLLNVMSKKMGLLGNIGRLTLLCYHYITVYYCSFSLRFNTNLTKLVKCLQLAIITKSVPSLSMSMSGFGGSEGGCVQCI